MKNKYEKLAADLLLRDPETDVRMDIVSPPQTNDDKSYSFEVQNPESKVRYRHTIRTEEI